MTAKTPGLRKLEMSKGISWKGKRYSVSGRCHNLEKLISNERIQGCHDNIFAKECVDIWQPCFVLVRKGDTNENW